VHHGFLTPEPDSEVFYMVSSPIRSLTTATSDMTTQKLELIGR